MHECFATVLQRCVVARKVTEALGGGQRNGTLHDPLRRVRESAQRMAAVGGTYAPPNRRGSDVLLWKTHEQSGLASFEEQDLSLSVWQECRGPIGGHGPEEQTAVPVLP